MGLDNELGVSRDYGRIEYAYYLMAKQAGINMMPCRLLLENGRAHFMTKRFDRTDDGERHHLQTLCAMSHLDYKKKGINAYEQYFMTLVALGLPYEQKEEAFRRMLFNVMSRNCDDHTKNFSFRLRAGQPWELSPAYDITFAHNPAGEWTHQHLMSINGKFKDFVLADFMTIADRFGVGTAKSVMAEIRQAVELWPSFAEKAGLSLPLSDDIKAQLLYF
jgi:serine/threonine-protein kinase HipA